MGPAGVAGGPCCEEVTSPEYLGAGATLSTSAGSATVAATGMMGTRANSGRAA